MIYSDSIQTDELAVSLTSTLAKTFTIEIDCFDGQFLSGEAVADAAIEARHGTGGAYTNIETTPIDLSAYAGSLETFQVRMTAGTITSHLTRAFRLRVGPPAETGDSLVFNDDEDLIYNDDEALILTFD